MGEGAGFEEGELARARGGVFPGGGVVDRVEEGLELGDVGLDFG